ncbi:sortase [Streptomyces tateyamensis]|uniref:Sortase n=1 Tax=Streptomyces tateyamensis TaxID=565073 RepID=A0A2V4N5S8_9ACTN|nr:sortase [Streptomyces tateyamensis]PYC76891.1 sortase [Streptomyces tateyamensis]
MTAPAVDRPTAEDDTLVLPAVPGAPSAPDAPSGRGRPRLAQAGWAATLLSGLLLGFAVYLLALSPLQEGHYQSTSYQTFRYQLANALAPTGPAPDGDPVAVLDIPRIGLHQAVVVEGTTGRDLMRGPGHRRDTALPGQSGAAVLFGRGTSFGSPFGRISELRVGDKIEVTTGQGQFSYTVNAYGDGAHPILDAGAPARLVLVTSDSGWVPTSTVLIGARLDGTPQPGQRGRPAQLAADHALAQDTGALAALQLWSAGLLGAVLLATLAVRRWHRRAAYLAFTPVLAALLWACYENAAALLPNLY